MSKKQRWLPEDEEIEQLYFDENHLHDSVIEERRRIAKLTAKKIYHRLNQAQSDKELRRLMDSLGKEILSSTIMESINKEIEES